VSAIAREKVFVPSIATVAAPDRPSATTVARPAALHRDGRRPDESASRRRTGILTLCHRSAREPRGWLT